MSPTFASASEAAWAVAWGAAAVLLLAAGVGVRHLRAAVAGTRPATWAALAAVLVVQAVVVATVVPAAPWHSFHHGDVRFAHLRDAAAWDDPMPGAQHGPAWYVLIRLVLPLVGDPFTATLALSVLGSLVGFALARVLLGDDDRALLVTAVHALLPVRLRVAHSVCLYVGAELLLLVALLAAALHLRDRSLRTFVPALAALLLAMSAHLELLVVAPVAVLALVAARDPRWFFDVLPRRPFLLALGAFVALALVRVGVVLVAPDDLLPARPHVRPALAQGRTRLLLALGVLALLGAVRAPPVALAGRWAVAARWAAALLVVAAAVPGARLLLRLGSLPFEGADRLHGVLEPWRRLSALLSPDWTPAPWPALLAVGLGWCWLHRLDVFRLVVIVLAPLAWLHAAHDDGVSTAVRIASLSAWLFALPVGVALALAVAPLPSVLRRLAVLAPAVALVPFLPWLAWRYPTQREFDVLVEAHAHVARGGTVVLPLPDDVPDDVEAGRHSLLSQRRHLGVFVRHPAGTVLGLREALRRDELPPDTLFLHALACHEGVETARPDGLDVLLAGRPWVLLASEPSAPGLFEALAPCWYQPEHAVCAEPDGEACRTWRCPAGLPRTGAPPYLDPLCAAVQERFRWTPLRLEGTEGPSLTSQQTAQLAPGARVGLYRYDGPR